MAKRLRLAKVKEIIGWREWVELPELGIARIKAKVDTGARTSALHAEQVQTFVQGGETYVRFKISSEQKHRRVETVCEAKLLDIRNVKNSGGTVEKRYTIRTLLSIGRHSFHVEVTLTDRAPMGFRMLLGRTALRRQFLVNPAVSFLLDQKD